MLTSSVRLPAPLVARAIALLLLAVAIVAVALAGSPATPGAQAAASAKKCSLTGKEQKLGPTYVTKLTVTGVSCSAGEKLVTAFYKCRTAKGGPAGRCVKKVSGYACTETRTSSPTQFDASVKCKNGSKLVAHTYTQNT